MIEKLKLKNVRRYFTSGAELIYVFDDEDDANIAYDDARNQLGTYVSVCIGSAGQPNNALCVSAKGVWTV